MWVFRLILYRGSKAVMFFEDGDRQVMLNLMGSQAFIDAQTEKNFDGWELRNVQVSQVGK